jgi:hypothetical protein
MFRALDHKKDIVLFPRTGQSDVIRPELIAKDPNGAGHRANLE